jgi:hypothetical protein
MEKSDGMFYSAWERNGYDCGQLTMGDKKEYRFLGGSICVTILKSLIITAVKETSDGTPHPAPSPEKLS